MLPKAIVFGTAIYSSISIVLFLLHASVYRGGQSRVPARLTFEAGSMEHVGRLTSGIAKATRRKKSGTKPVPSKGVRSTRIELSKVLGLAQALKTDTAATKAATKPWSPLYDSIGLQSAKVTDVSRPVLTELRTSASSLVSRTLEQVHSVRTIYHTHFIGQLETENCHSQEQSESTVRTVSTP